MHIASNSLFHEWPKNIEIDYDFIREKMQSNAIVISFPDSHDQLEYLLTKYFYGVTEFNIFYFVFFTIFLNLTT